MEQKYTMTRKCVVSNKQWEDAANRFELGLRNGNELARDLGVSPQTVMREMKRRGARKGSRVHEALGELNALIDRKQRLAARRRAELERMAEEHAESTLALVGQMVAAILKADQLGDLGLVAGTIDQATAALGAKLPRRSRRR